MTDRTLPHASAVMNRACTELIMHNERRLSSELASIHRATCDLVHSYSTMRAASTPADQTAARSLIEDALARLRGRAPEGIADREAAFEAAAPEIQRLQQLLKHRRDGDGC